MGIDRCVRQTYTQCSGPMISFLLHCTPSTFNLLRIGCIISRLVAAFCLGWTFVTAFHCVISSPFIRIFFSRFFSRTTSRPVSRVITLGTMAEKSSIGTSSLLASVMSNDDHYVLRLLMFLAVASSAVTRFISLCSFPSGADTACGKWLRTL